MATTENPKYLDPKAIERIKRIDVRARLVVEGFMTGQHKSPYHGFAVEFAAHREYAPGDDIKHIDWKVWSKTDRLYIKQYEEETNLKCTIILDCSKSMRYGEKTEGQWSKFDYGATAAASMAYLMQQQQDAVGLITFNTKIDLNLPHSASPSHLRLLFHEMQQISPDDKTDVGAVFPQLARQIRQRGIVILISDLFVDLETLANAMNQLRMRRHEVIVFHIMHDDELTFPFQDNTLFRGLEMDMELHTEPRALRRSYLDVMNKFREQVRKICSKSGIDYVLMSSKDPLDAALASYLTFRQRNRRNTGRHS